MAEELKGIEKLKLPRCLKPLQHNDATDTVELHHFSDASEHAYGTCSYMRCLNKEGVVGDEQ